MYDIAIIGLGPAGATLARQLDKKYKVIAIDKKNDKHTKCCGGLLAPDAQKILAKFDICLPKEVLVDPQIFSVRTIDIPNKLERFYQRFYMNMDRSKFDEFLISLVPKHVEVLRDSICKKVIKKEDGYHLEIKKKEENITIQSKIVIGADGANSMIRTAFYPNKKIKKYVSIQEWYENSNLSPFYSCIFDKKITNSYCWTISKDQYFIIGGAFPIKDSEKRFEMLKQKVQEKGIQFKNKIKREGCYVSMYQNINSICTGKKDAYLIGEAAGMISPSSLEGISYAMNSASILANIINKEEKNIARKYYTKTLKIRIQLLFKIIKKPFMYQTFLRNLVMRSNLTAMKK